MGIIKAVVGAIGGGLADSWLEVYESDSMNDATVFTTGVKVRQGDKRSSNTKGTEDTVSNGSIIHVYDNQCMLLVDGGKVVDYTAEPGYYKVDQSSMPSLFNGELGASVKETFSRVKYGGVPSGKQKVFFINLQEIKGIKFGTRNPLQYYDNFYNSELFLRAHGSYSIKITDPLKFYTEAVPRNASRVDITDINEQYLNEFLEALQAAINQLSADGERISFLPSKGRELSKYMSTTLDEDWRQMRGMEIQAVGIASLSYDEESQKLINMRNQGAMLSDPSVREGYVQGAMARGVEAAGSNSAGAAQAFMGVGMGMNAGAGMAGAFSQANQQQMYQQQQQRAAAPQEEALPLWVCACGTKNSASMKFCGECGAKKPEPKPEPKPEAKAGGWTCACGTQNPENMKFCPECGAKKPEPKPEPKPEAKSGGWTCACGMQNPESTKFCPECGAKKPEPQPESKPEPTEWTCACGAVNPVAMRFCPECGARKPETSAAPAPEAPKPPKAAFCAECGAKLDPAARFCAECGARVEE